VQRADPASRRARPPARPLDESASRSNSGLNRSEWAVDRARSVQLFNVVGMSSRSNPKDTAHRLAAHAGITIADARRRRHWTLRELGDRAEVSPSMVHAVDHGSAASLETYVAIAAALDLELRLDLVDPRTRATTARAEDPVHAAMGEMFATRLASQGFPVAIDEPYQHFQFAGRADLLAWDLDRRALLHVENRTRFPNVQEAIGSYNAKRRYLPAVMAERLGIRHGFSSVTNVMAGLGSNEVIHVVRIRSATFRAVCPDDTSAVDGWWSGSPFDRGGSTSAFVLVDPADGAIIGLESAVLPTTRPRYRGYAATVEALATNAGQ
jgi:transcriptional regulator with XRE-family HTH domain